jgi:large subunit ribosomal protein L12
MQNIYAALLLHSAGKEINEDGIKRTVHAAGGTVDESSVKSLIASLKGVDINKALEEAKSAPVAAAAAPAAEKKEEKKEEPKPEIAAEGLAALFG